jgi:hypothetical protein
VRQLLLELVVQLDRERDQQQLQQRRQGQLGGRRSAVSWHRRSRR